MGLIIKGPASPTIFPIGKYMEIHCQNFHASFDGSGENNILKTSKFRDFSYSSLNFSLGEKIWYLIVTVNNSLDLLLW